MNRERGAIIPIYSAEYNALLQLHTCRIFAVIIAAHREARRRLNEKKGE